jgi:hypothetical protein
MAKGVAFMWVDAGLVVLGVGILAFSNPASRLRPRTKYHRPRSK